MKRKALTILMALVMVFTFMPLSRNDAFAGTTETTPIMTAATGGQETGLSLVGGDTADYGTDYEFVHTEGSSDKIKIKTSGWKLIGQPNDSITTGALFIDVGDLTSGYMSFTIGDVKQNTNTADTVIYLTVRSGNDINVRVDANDAVSIYGLGLLADITGGDVTLSLDSNSPLTVQYELLFRADDEVNIDEPGTLNIEGMAGFPCDELNVDEAVVHAAFGIDDAVVATVNIGANTVNVVNGGKLIAINSSINGGYGIYYGGSTISVDDESELFASGYTAAISGSDEYSFDGDLNCSGDFVAYENRNVVNTPTDIKKVDSLNEYVPVVKDSNPVIIAKTVYSAPTGQFVVKFNLQGHGSSIADVKVKKGAKVSEPEAPVADGFTFGGWYKEAGCKNKWDFANDTVTADTTLYAKWVAEKGPVNPDDPKDANDENETDTGDHNIVLPCTIAMILALAGMVIVTRRKREN